jgi:hypothetical protein
MGKGGKTERAWLCNVVHVNGMVRCRALRAGAGLAKSSSNQRARQHLGAAPIQVNDTSADVTVDVVLNSDNSAKEGLYSDQWPGRRRLTILEPQIFIKCCQTDVPIITATENLLKRKPRT